jgi:uncharacterized protein YbjT (DUF2867 family)
MENPPANVEPFLFDFNHPPEDLGPLLADVQRMFLLWPPGVDVKSALGPVIEAAVKHGVKQVVFLSILAADKLKVVPHRAVEKMLEESGMSWVFLRSAYFMQNLTGMHAPEIRERDEIFIPAGKGDLGMVDVRDVAAVGAKALVEDHRNMAYSLTGAEALTFARTAEIFSDVLGRPIRYTNPPTFKFTRQMKKRGVPGGLVTFMVIEYLATKLGKSGTVTTEVEGLLSRPPRSLEEFVSDHAEVWQR